MALCDLSLETPGLMSYVKRSAWHPSEPSCTAQWPLVSSIGQHLQPFTGHGGVSIWWKILGWDETAKTNKQTNKQTHKQKDQWITCSNEGRGGGGVRIPHWFSYPFKTVATSCTCTPYLEASYVKQGKLRTFFGHSNSALLFLGNIWIATLLLCITTRIESILCGFFFH